MKTISQQRTAVLQETVDAADAVSVLIVCEDYEMGAAGKFASDLFVKEMRKGGRAELFYCSFGLFRLWEFNEAVRSISSTADVILMAVRNRDRLPALVESWLRELPALRTKHVGVLAVLFDAVGGPDAMLSPVAQLAGEAASLAGMGWLCSVAAGLCILPAEAAPVPRPEGGPQVPCVNGAALAAAR